ncbi:unnamed protein product [Porites evermanni]|uniref:Uncharacterized protein n=1 Tax=Porites evermanni TaxID=104178 RepID=A0ABN8LXT9_9CNID|nr:unnamed protein product [Porites evermanni]
MADFTRVSSKHGDVEMANRNEHYHAYENKAYLADPGQNAGNNPGWRGNQEEEDFDPWAPPELQDLGPKWSELDCRGKFLRVALAFTKIFLLLVFCTCSSVRWIS